MRLFHYTTLGRFKFIEHDGLIKPATAYVKFNERPAVWFSTHPSWEPTASKLIHTWGGVRRATIKQMIDNDGGLVRIEIAPETAPYCWREFKIRSGVSSKVIKGLVRAATEQGAKPSQWFVSFDPVPRDKWLAVEHWQGSEWTANGVAAAA